jgi:hypothetical protein
MEIARGGSATGNETPGLKSEGHESRRDGWISPDTPKFKNPGFQPSRSGLMQTQFYPALKRRAISDYPSGIQMPTQLIHQSDIRSNDFPDDGDDDADSGQEERQKARQPAADAWGEGHEHTDHTENDRDDGEYDSGARPDKEAGYGSAEGDDGRDTEMRLILCDCCCIHISTFR